jgi:DNA-binding GntR family transcriptional regulator
MMFKKGNIPLYFQFYLHLKQEIVSGDRPPGSPISTLNELADQTGISHGMIRKALELLEKEELIVKNPRRGTFVRESNQKALWVPTASLSEIREELIGKKVVSLSGGFIDPPNRVLAHFGHSESILKDGRMYRSHFILISRDDERRKHLAYLFIPFWRYNDVSLKEIKRSPIITVASGSKIKNIKQVTRPWFCDHYSSEHLRIPNGTPILHRTIVPYLSNGETLCVLEMVTNINAMEREITIE